MFDKIDNLNSQTRVLIAVLLALAFFVPYSYFYQPQVAENNETQQTAMREMQNVVTANASNQVAQNIVKAPTQNSTIIATIESANFTYKIDRLGRITEVNLKAEKYQKDSAALSLFPEDVANANNPKILEIRFRILY